MMAQFYGILRHGLLAFINICFPMGNILVLTAIILPSRLLLTVADNQHRRGTDHAGYEVQKPIGTTWSHSWYRFVERCYLTMYWALHLPCILHGRFGCLYGDHQCVPIQCDFENHTLRYIPFPLTNPSSTTSLKANFYNLSK